MTIFVSYNKRQKSFRSFHAEAHNLVFQAKNEKSLLQKMRATLKAKRPDVKIAAVPELRQIEWNDFHTVFAKVSLPNDSWEVTELDPTDLI